MKIRNEIRIKIEDGIPDDVAACMVADVIGRGKISENTKGEKKYCWISTYYSDRLGFNCRVTLMDYRKTTMFYITKDE